MLADSHTLAVAATEASLQAAALELAQRLSLPFVEHFAEHPDLDREEPSQLLLMTPSGLQLQQTGRKRSGPVWVDFVSGAVAHRRLYGGGKGQMIAKACGIKGSLRPSIADVTAGLGRDAFVLATLGCSVQLVERSPVVHALLADGLARAAQAPEVADILARMSLVHADARQWLQSVTEASAPDVVYLDPMFPHSDKSAQVKKEMLAFRGLVGADADAPELLAAALAAARCRVVVKRPRKAPPIEGPAPSFMLEGKAGRYDIYALRKIE